MRTTLTILALIWMIGCVTINKYYIVPKETVELKSNDPIQFPFDGIDDWGGEPGFYIPPWRVPYLNMLGIDTSVIASPFTLELSPENQDWAWDTDTSIITWNDIHNLIISDSCKHASYMSTLVFCGGDKCNTCTCLTCGKEWKCN
jgi:hypothetical protein